jgi:hypothetical protein
MDFDYLRFESDGTTLVVAGEEASTVRAFLVKDFQKESEFITAQGKVQAGANVLSVSVGPLRVADSSNFTVLVAVAIFDHCSVEFFELSRAGGEKLVFTPLPGKKMQSIHKMPVRQVRLSKKQPQLMVSCGDESDLYLKLWNLAGSKTDPVNQLQTNQIKHKFMTQSHDIDYFSVAAKTSEVRIFQVAYNQGALKGVSIGKFD